MTMFPKVNGEIIGDKIQTRIYIDTTCHSRYQIQISG